MTIKNSLALEIKELLSGLSEHGSQHLTEIETDLVQTNVLLSEAIEKLGASFMAIHEAVSAQQQLVDTLLAQAPAAAVGELRTKAAQIDQHVNAAVTGLQFQDMTNQLIGRAMRRLVGVRDVLEVLGTHSAGIPADADPAQLQALLAKTNESIKTQNSNLENELWKAVRQTHMESGDVELF
ncbi:chemotaxis protein [Herminiimonas glaciei]|uniref:Chemotaxis protein n=1 Tax=Herminiimonas glaciei TaxID=523788 RepID=A0ABW2I7W4_9BURK